MKKLFYLIVVIILITNINACYAQLAPPSMEWYENWLMLRDGPGVPPELKNAVVTIPLVPMQDNTPVFSLYLTNGLGELCGDIAVNSSGTSVKYFMVGYSKKKEIFGFPGTATITEEEAKKIAQGYLDYLPKEYTDGLVQCEMHGLDYCSRGVFEFTYEAIKDDMIVSTIRMIISREKYITTFSRTIFNQQHGTNIMKSPGRKVVESIIKAKLRELGFAETYFTRILRSVKYDGDNPNYYWGGMIRRSEGKRQLEAIFNYNEFTKKIIIYEWLLVSEDELRKAISYAESPVFSADGKQLWWSSRSYWERYPKWSLLQAYSLAVMDYEPGKTQIYRPLIDYHPVVIDYSRPSPSPDGRWMACYAARQQRLMFIDLQYNRLYMRSDIMGISRISWNADASLIAMAETSAKHAYIMKVIGDSGIPFDSEPQQLPIVGEVVSFTFLPNSNDSAVAVIRPKELLKDDNGWQLTQVTLKPDGTCTLVPILTKIAQPSNVKISPDGKQLIYIDDLGGKIVDLARKKSDIYEPFTQGKKVAADVIIDLPDFSYCFTPDGNSIIFTARTAWGSALFRMTLAGEDCTLITSNDPNVEYERYRIQGKYALVPIDNIPNRLLAEFGYTESFYWPANVPIIGHWDRPGYTGRQPY